MNKIYSLKDLNNLDLDSQTKIDIFEQLIDYIEGFRLSWKKSDSAQYVSKIKNCKAKAKRKFLDKVYVLRKRKVLLHMHFNLKCLSNFVFNSSDFNVYYIVNKDENEEIVNIIRKLVNKNAKLIKK